MDNSRAVQDLWRHTLSQIDTVFGRLEYLASLRNHHTGRYEHFGLEQRFGAEKSHGTLCKSHEEIFSDWIGFSLEAQRRELKIYLSGREETTEEIVGSWLKVRPFATWIPAGTRHAERTLFLTDLDTILELIRREYGVGAPDSEA